VNVSVLLRGAESEPGLMWQGVAGGGTLPGRPLLSSKTSTVFKLQIVGKNNIYVPKNRNIVIMYEYDEFIFYSNIILYV